MVSEPTLEIKTHIAVRLDHYIVIIGGDTANSGQDHVIWMHNLYTEQWKRYLVPTERACVVPYFYQCGVTIGKDIYIVLENPFLFELWRLTQNAHGHYVWDNVFPKHGTKEPSPRDSCTAWEYAGKMWMFGVWGTSRIGQCNNQLLLFNPVSKEWTNPKCFGEVPVPRHQHTTTAMGHKVWLYGGSSHRNTLDDVYELDMISLTWTQIQTGQPRPRFRDRTSLTALTARQLVLHGGHDPGVRESSLSDTWILDLSSLSWRQYTIGNVSPREGHTGTSGINNDIYIFGGWKSVCTEYMERLGGNHDSFHLMLEAKNLQQLAMQTVFRHRNEIPWRCLPKKLIDHMDLEIEIV